MTAEKVVIERKDVALEINANNIDEVIFDNTDDIKDTPSFGLTLGFPNVVNLTAAYSANYFHTRITGGIIPTGYAGIQGLIGYPIYDQKKL